MKHLGLKRRKAGSVPGKADPEKQRHFVRKVIEPWYVKCWRRWRRPTSECG
jgi:hypothetical protein